jgi:membrane protease YdiL (CAAX protease family)
MTDTSPRNAPTFGEALVVLAVWVAITLGPGLIAGEERVSIDRLVSREIGLGFVLAVVFLLLATRAFGWQGLGLQAPASGRKLVILWMPVLYILAIVAGACSVGLPPAGTIAIVLVNTSLIGVSEELMFRGILLRGAVARFTIWPAVVLTSAIFGLVHTLNGLVTGQFLLSSLQALAASMSGFFYLAVRIRTRSLYPMIVVHALWDGSLIVLATAVGGTTREAVSAAQLVVPVLIVVPLFLYGLFLLRNVGRDYRGAAERAAE